MYIYIEDIYIYRIYIYCIWKYHYISYGKITMFNRGIELDEPWLPYLSSIANP